MVTSIRRLSPGLMTVSPGTMVNSSAATFGRFMNGATARASSRPVWCGQAYISPAMTASVSPAASRKGRAPRSVTSRRGRSRRTSSLAPATTAAISAWEPSTSGASLLVSSSTAELMRSCSSGWFDSTARAMPASVKLWARGRIRKKIVASSVRASAAPLIVQRGQEETKVKESSTAITTSTVSVATAATPQMPRRNITHRARRIRRRRVARIDCGNATFVCSRLMLMAARSFCE